MTRRRSRGRPQDQQAAHEPAWQRIDLHIHTPGSVDYQEPRATYLDILQKAEARGLAIIAFTDHNSVAGYAALRRDIEHLEFLEAGDRLQPEEARRLSEYQRLLDHVLVLPGFEFTATFGFHILGIFPPETSVRKLEHVLLELNVPEDKLDQGTSEVGATTDVLRCYEVIADAGGLVIGAHVNSTHGIAMIGLGFGGQTKIAYTQDPHLHALEVTDLDSTSRRATARFFNGSKPEYPRRMHCIQGSDAHRVTRDPQRPDKNLGIGDRCTEVLLPEVSFAALQTLFSSSDFGRTRPYHPTHDPFASITSARADGATIVQSFHDAPGPPIVRVKSILKDIVAFANTNGGTVYVGASADPQEPIHGVEGATELAELIRGEAARQIAPPLTPDIENLASDGKQVLVVTVSRGAETPYALEPGYIYVRQEGETALALRDEIVQLVRASLDLAASVEPEADGLAAASQRRAAPTPPAAHAAQQEAVRQAEVAEQERQQERTPLPRTGVEIIASNERNGVLYHTVRDLRNRRVVRNVTRESARRLWRYAILQVENHPVRPEDVHWDERDPRLGFWKGYRQPEGMCRYNLVYREAARNGDGGERLRVFYGVTEEGVDDRWRAVLPPESTLTEVYYDEPLPPAEAPATPSPAPVAATVTDLPAEVALDVISAPAEPARMAAPVPEPEQPVVTPATIPEIAAASPAPEEQPDPPAQAPARRRRTTRKTTAAPPAPAESGVPDLPPGTASDGAAALVPPAPEEQPAPPKRRRAARRPASGDATIPPAENGATAPHAEQAALSAANPATTTPPAPEEQPDPPPRALARRRRAPRQVAAPAQPGENS
ncbi:MAG TPA: RNA-binding domain-containing protein [Thermomicrobiales bacterium]|nr:RNA-binding domain-containing protein [Thermomicrobiales bacterium]